jgi:DNA-binding MarR family transcriptional regulator
VSTRDAIPLTVTHRVRDACLCLHVQRAARALARRFDDALRPAGLTSGQFSLLMTLTRPEPPNIAQVSAWLAMDRTTLTANLKPLERRGLLKVVPGVADRRSRLLRITRKGRAGLRRALPLWERTLAEIEQQVSAAGADRLRADLRRIA